MFDRPPRRPAAVRSAVCAVVLKELCMVDAFLLVSMVYERHGTEDEGRGETRRSEPQSPDDREQRDADYERVTAAGGPERARMHRAPPAGSSPVSLPPLPARARRARAAR